MSDQQPQDTPTDLAVTSSSLGLLETAPGKAPDGFFGNNFHLELHFPALGEHLWNEIKPQVCLSQTCHTRGTEIRFLVGEIAGKKVNLSQNCQVQVTACPSCEEIGVKRADLGLQSQPLEIN